MQTGTMFKNLYTAILIFASAGKLFAAGGMGVAVDDFPPAESGDFTSYKLNPLTTEWMTKVEAVLPSKYFTNGSPTLQQTTNLLCQESQRGNKAALGLWGIAVVAYSQSPEELQTGLDMLTDSAQSGYVSAMVNLAILYDDGAYVPRNYDDAFYWYTVAATNGDTFAELELGACYHYGLGTKPDETMAANLYHLAAEKTNYVAMKSYGYCLMNGRGVTKDLDAAKYWLTRAAKEGGNRRAMYNLGVLCDLKFPDTNAMAEAFQWYHQSAELGDALACNQLADCYYNGWGVTNLSTSRLRYNYLYWLVKAAALGSTDAQYLLGAAYRTGDGMPQNIDDSIVWYRKAAAKNHPEANYDLALYCLEGRTNLESLKLAGRYMLAAAQEGNKEAQFQCALYYSQGDALPQDGDVGKQWMAKAADNGWAKAEFALFYCYYSGTPIAPGCQPYPQDKTEGLKWLRRAADHGDLRAQSTLAVKLIQGDYMDRDVAEAEKLLRDAAEHGYVEAQNDLGYALLHGDINSTDELEPAMWCQLAESHWNNPKKQMLVEANLRNALSRLTPDQQAEVQQRVNNFHAQAIPEPDPLVKDWNQLPSYQQEDGRFGH